MDNIWYNYNDDSKFAELYEELGKYLDDPAIYEPNDDISPVKSGTVVGTSVCPLNFDYLYINWYYFL